jgi:tryptophanyl-tRNA synthetase
MSKSAGNTILLSDSPEEIGKKMRTAVTDPQKVRRNDPGRPEICLVYTYHQRFNPASAGQIAEECRAGTLGCVDCKGRAAAAIAGALAPVRDRRAHFETHPSEVAEILADGERRGREVAQQTMAEVRGAMGIG